MSESFRLEALTREVFGAQPANVVFTSGATEAATQVVRAFERDRRVIVGATEHDAIRAAAPDADMSGKLDEVAEAAGLTVLRLIRKTELPAGASAALTAAILAEDLAPRLE